MVVNRTVTFGEFSLKCSMNNGRPADAALSHTYLATPAFTPNAVNVYPLTPDEFHELGTVMISFPDSTVERYLRNFVASRAR